MDLALLISAGLGVVAIVALGFVAKRTKNKIDDQIVKSIEDLGILEKLIAYVTGKHKKLK